MLNLSSTIPPPSSQKEKKPHTKTGGPATASGAASLKRAVNYFNKYTKGTKGCPFGGGGAAIGGSDLLAAGEWNRLVAPCVTEEIPATTTQKRANSINWLFKSPVLATSLRRSFTMKRSNIQHDEHGDYPPAYNKPLFAFEEPFFFLSSVSQYFSQLPRRITSGRPRPLAIDPTGGRGGGLGQVGVGGYGWRATWEQRGSCALGSAAE